jgi:1,2-diacylglycerol 3-alpha-glucosyltransferase
MMADTYKPHISGITNYIEVNKRYLEKAGHEVFVFTFGDLDYKDDEPRIIRSPGLPIADSGYYLSLRYSPSAKKALRTMDVIHVHHPFLSGRLALHYLKPFRIPIVFTNHTRYDLYAQTYLPMMPEEVSQGLLQAYMPSFCQAVDLVIAPSAGMKRVLQELNVESHIEVLPNGVELTRFKHAEPRPRADFGFTENDILLVYAGRVAPEKNLSFLLRAFSGIAQALPHTHLIIIGSGQKQYEEELQALAGELKLNQRARFMGLINYDNLPAYLTMCDAFVTASITEVHPLSVIEAMGAGLPIMGIDSVGVGDTVQDGVTGFLSNHELAAFTAKLTRLCLDQNLRQRMSDSARKASTVYSIKRTTQSMLKHYERLVHNSNPRRGNWSVRLRGLLEQFLS